VIHDDVVRVLLGMGVAPNVLSGFPELPAKIEGLLVYGSQAREDSVPGSDLDLLGLVNAPRPSTHSGDVNISYYTRDQLLTGVGTLFGGPSRSGCPRLPAPRAVTPPSSMHLLSRHSL
jgi:hypothetical protein